MRCMWLSIFFFLLDTIECTLRPSHVTIWNPKTKQYTPGHPETQHIPENPSFANERPPHPLLPKTTPTIFIGISSFRDGTRCGNTLYTIFSMASDPYRITVGVVDQRMDDEEGCLEEYCTLAKKKGYAVKRSPDVVDNNVDMKWKDCPHVDQIRILKKNAQESRGPCVARSWQQTLIDQEDFCLQVDAHSMFMKDWDEMLLADWLKADNEMAVLSTYILAYASKIKKTWNHNQHPHLCAAMVGTYGMVRNSGASIVGNIITPQLTSLWGAGLSFSKCHAEKRVVLDPKALWIFDGEEFMKAARLWTAGYDMYSPSVFAIYHDYAPVPHKFFQLEVNKEEKKEERTTAVNRMNMILGLPYEGSVGEDIEKYQMDSVRSFDNYLNYSGINLKNRSQDANRCLQLHWMPFEKQEAIDALINMQLDKGFTYYQGEPHPAGADWTTYYYCSTALFLLSAVGFIYRLAKKYKAGPKRAMKEF